MRRGRSWGGRPNGPGGQPRRRRLLSRRGLLLVVVAAALLSGLFTHAAGAGPKSSPHKATVGEDLPATANSASDARANNTPMLAADPTDGRFVVMAHRIDAPDFGCALEVSGDGGRTFIGAGPVPHLPAGADKCYAPDVGFDRRGALYYLFVGLRGNGNVPMGVFISRSVDHAQTFSVPHEVLGANNYSVRMAIDRSIGPHGRIHLVWLAANGPSGLGSLPPPPNPIMSAYSDDGGQTWSKPVQVSDPKRRLVVAPALALGPHHSVYVAYYDLGGDQIDYFGLEGTTWSGKWSIAVSSSIDGGKRFSPGGVVDNQLAPPERVLLIFTMPPPALAADGHGRVFVAWYDARNGDWDAFLRRSTDGGRTWGSLQRLNDDPVGDGRNQYQPQLGVAPDGRVDAIFYDRRNDPGNMNNDVFFTYSTDGGQRFARNVKITTQSSDSRVGPTYVGPAATGLVEFGSRIGLLSTQSGAVAAWTDTRDAPEPEYQDLFSTPVRLTPGGG